MHAVIKTGGKQYRVAEGEFITIEKLEAEAGTSVDFDHVLLISDGDTVKIGEPTLSGAKVTAEVVDQKRASKIEIIKFKRRKHHMKRQGHRQYLTQVKITKIAG